GPLSHHCLPRRGRARHALVLRAGGPGAQDADAETVDRSRGEDPLRTHPDRAVRRRPGRAMMRTSREPTMPRPLIALVLTFTLTSAVAEAQEAAPPPAPQPAPGFVQPKTPWGDPDIQGFWPGVEMVGVPLQRPARFGTRNVLTEAEFNQRARE